MSLLPIERHGRTVWVCSVILFAIVLSLTAYASAADIPLAFGELYSGTISTIGEIDKYKFDASAGDHIFVRMGTLTLSQVDPYFRIYAPDGTLLHSGYRGSPGAAEYASASLTQTGTYKIIAEDYGIDDTGDYRIFIQRLNNPELTHPIAFGEDLLSTLDLEGDTDTYTFDALEGDRVMVRMSTTGSSEVEAYIRLYAPDGSYLYTAYDNAAPGAPEIVTGALPSSGTYTVLAHDYYHDDIGDYRIYIQRLNNPEIQTSIVFGETLTGSINYTGQMNTYTFDALEGDRVVVRMSTASPSEVESHIRLYAPDGSYLYTAYDSAAPGATEIITGPLPSSGIYTVLAQDAYIDDIGNYRIYVQRLNNPEAALPVGFDDILVGSLVFAGEMKTYTFDAIENDVVLVRMSTANPSLVGSHIRLFAPDGSHLYTAYDPVAPGAAEINTAPLPASGTYTVLAQDSYNDDTGDYLIQLSLITGISGSLIVRPMQSLIATGSEGGPFTPDSIDYTLENIGPDPVDWSISKSQDWLDVSESGGTLAAGNTATIALSINSKADALSAGTYFDTLTFSNLTEADQIILRDVALLVRSPEGSIVVTPNEPFTSTGPRHGPFTPASKTYTLQNTGNALMEWKVVSNATWLTVSPAQGDLNSGGTVDVNVSINATTYDFAWGEYTDRIAFINTTNGNGDTLRDVVLSIEAVPSEISCELSETSVVLGEPIEVTGQITPQPTQSGAFVGITLVAPDAAEVHRSVVANSLGEFSYTVACEDITRAGDWKVRAGWSGDEGLYGSNSEYRNLTVTQAESRLSINSTSQALKINVPVDLSGKFTPQPDCGGDLTGISIELHISGPSGTQTLTVDTLDRWGHYALQDYTGFNELGDWTVEAVFAGDTAFSASSSEILKVKVVETAGYAIVVQGKVGTQEGLASHNKTANFVYDQLLDRGLLDDDVMYFNYDDSQPGVDGIPSRSGIQNAVTIWARDKLNAIPANLYLVLIDHGFDNVFFIHPNTISATELGDWLDNLQAGLTPQAAEQEKIILLGFCRSGSFIDELSGAHRVVIASAAAHESSYKGPLDADGIREGEYFINEFFKSVAFGKNIQESFQQAVVLTEAFTSSDWADSSNGPFFDKALQHPLLDDNGDGEGSNDLGDPTGDGLLSSELFIGINTLSTNDPEDVAITQVTGTLFLGTNQDNAYMWAQVDNNSRLDTIWVEIKPTIYAPTGEGGSEQIEMDLVKAAFDRYTATYDRYEWLNLEGFPDAGTYQVFYFARDSQTGNVSPLMQTTVYRAKADNSAPDPFSLILPQDGATELTSLILDWQDTSDPDDDPLTYTVLLSKDDPMFTNPFRKEGLSYSTCLLTPADGLQDLSTYYWKVLAIDRYGAVRESEVRVFHTNNTNPVAGWIHGHVSDAATGQPIVGAEVNIGSSTLTTSDGGYYLGVFAPGDYSAEAIAAGYDPVTYDQVAIPEGGLAAKDFELLPQVADSDGDGIPNAVETASVCLDPLDADSDDDGLADGTEDSDKDGVLDEGETDPCDVDSDGDGIQDGTELGVSDPVADPDGSGPLKGTDTAVFQPDLDPSTTTDPLMDDSDNDGLSDGEEDSNHNGRVDPGETDPNRVSVRSLNHIWLLLL